LLIWRGICPLLQLRLPSRSDLPYMFAVRTYPYSTRQVERLRKLSKQWRKGDAEAFRSLNKEVSQFTPDEYYHVSACYGTHVDRARFVLIMGTNQPIMRSTALCLCSAAQPYHHQHADRWPAPSPTSSRWPTPPRRTTRQA
jgi:hypothetical protein